jgi:hypothetical protein
VMTKKLGMNRALPRKPRNSKGSVVLSSMLGTARPYAVAGWLRYPNP